jgi:hypothetical protein
LSALIKCVVRARETQTVYLSLNQPEGQGEAEEDW